MDADRPAGTMSDPALDRELRALLAIEPTPAFAARVRGRIAAQPVHAAPPVWIRGVVAGAAALAAAVVLALMPWRASDPPRVAPLSAARLPGYASVAVPAHPAADISRADDYARVGPEAVTARRAPAPDTDALPEIVIDPREAAALRALIDRARSGRVTMTAGRPARSTESDVLTSIDIPFITIDPLAASAAEGARP